MTLSKAKYVISAAVLLFPLQANALDFTPDATRILSDPNYLPLAGQIYGYTSYAHTWTDFDTFNDVGAQTSSSRTNADLLDQFLAYGVTDDLTVHADIRYQPDATRKVSFADGTSATFDSSGFSDPTFGATYRVLDQAVNPVSLDLFASYTPDAIDSKFASPTQNGTFATGGQSGTIGGAIGQEMRAFSIRGSMQAIFNGDHKAIDLSDNAPITTNAFTNYLASIQTQTRLTDRFSVNAGFTYTFDANQSIANLANGVSHVTAPGDIASVNAALNYHLVPNQAVVALTYNYNSYGDTKNSFALPALNTEVRNRRDNVLGVRFDYVMP